jgi:hypothetical protein
MACTQFTALLVALLLVAATVLAGDMVCAYLNFCVVCYGCIAAFTASLGQLQPRKSRSVTQHAGGGQPAAILYFSLWYLCTGWDERLTTVRWLRYRAGWLHGDVSSQDMPPQYGPFFRWLVDVLHVASANECFGCASLHHTPTCIFIMGNTHDHAPESYPDMVPVPNQTAATAALSSHHVGTLPGAA